MIERVDSPPASDRESVLARDDSTSGRVERMAIAALIVAFVAIGALFALQQPPFVAPDESPHVGYAHEVAEFRLPEIDTTPHVPESATQWAAEIDSRTSVRSQQVWVANHPPLYYAAVAPLTWLSRATDRADGGLLWFRFVNVGFAALGIAFTYLLAHEVSGRWSLGLAAAAAAAFTTQVHAAVSQALNDGFGFAAATAVLWAGVRCLRRGRGRTEVVTLAVCAAVAMGARSSTAVLAWLVVAAVAFAAAKDAQPDIRVRAAGRVAVIGLLPGVVAFGWFYVRNIVLYGDPAGSDALMERFDRQSRGGFWAKLADHDLWWLVYRRLMTDTTLNSSERPPYMGIVAFAAVMGLVLVFAGRRVGRRGLVPAAPTVQRRSVALLCVAVAVTAAGMAQHVGAGGLAHPRYLLPAVGAIATILVVALDRLGRTVLPWLLVVGMAVWTLSRVPRDVDPAKVRRPRDNGGPAPVQLQNLPGSDYWRSFTALWIVVGVVGVVVTGVALGAGALGARRMAAPIVPSGEPVAVESVKPVRQSA